MTSEMTTSDMQRFLTKWVEEDRGYVTPCHIWTKGKFGMGYGMFTIKGHPVLAHRWILEQEIGDLGSLNALHHCDQRDCVNVQHLYAGTQKQNVADEMSRSNHRLRGHNSCKVCGKALEHRRGQRRCPDGELRAHRRLSKELNSYA